MRRNVRKWLQGSLAVLAVAVFTPLALLALAVLVLESEWGERKIETYASDKLAREVQIEDIDLRLAWPPAIHIAQLQVANPEWAHTKNLVAVEDLTAVVQIWPLFSGKVVLERLVTAQVSLGLEQEGERATWRIRTGSGQGGSPFRLHFMKIGQGWIYFARDRKGTELHLQVAGTLGPEGELTAKAAGQVRGEPLQGIARATGVELVAEQRMRVSFEASIAKTTVTGHGTLQASSDGIGHVDATFDVSGPGLAALGDLLDTELPPSPAYQVRGRVVHDVGTWTFDPLEARLGGSKMEGRLSYDTRAQPPMVRASFQSERLDFGDLPKLSPGETSDGLIPDTKLRTEHWDAVNADVRLHAKALLGTGELPLGSLTVHAKLDGRVLTLDPLAFGFAGGKAETRIAIDGSVSPPRGELRGEMHKIDLARLVPRLRYGATTLGTLSGRARLEGAGASVDAMAATSDGEVAFVIEDGRIAALLVEAVGLDLAEALAVLAARTPTTPLRCAVADFVVDDGVASTRAFVIDTRDTLVTLKGTVDLGRERMHLVTHPQPKDPSLVSLNAPVVISGPLTDPDISLKIGQAVAQAVAGGLLALVNPLLALAPFVELGLGENANCAKLIAQARNLGPDTARR